MRYKFVKDGRGKRHRVFVNDSGNAHMGFLREFHERRSKRSRTMDEGKASAINYGPMVTPEEAYRWMRDPGASDIASIDGPRRAGQQNILSFNVVRLDDPGDLKPAVERPGDVGRYARKHPNASVWEVCPECDEEILVRAYGVSCCPRCGASVIPCAMCDPDRMDCRDCPYEN